MFRKFLAWLKRPHGLPLVLIYLLTAAVIAASIVLTVFPLQGGLAVLVYCCYGAAAVALGYTVYTIVVFAPALKRRAAEAMKRNPFTAKLSGQYGFRTVVFSVFSFTVGAVNALINGVIGIVYLSVWYGVLGGYYILLTCMRGGVLLSHAKKGKEENVKRRDIKTYGACGIMLILLPLALSFVILETVVSKRAFIRAGLMIYVAAAYTCYKIVMSVYNFFKARKHDEMTVRAIRNINLADALVSVLALQTAMFHEFSPNENFGLANALTGAAICLLTAATGVFMIVNASRKMKALREETQDE